MPWLALDIGWAARQHQQSHLPLLARCALLSLALIATVMMLVDFLLPAGRTAESLPQTVGLKDVAAYLITSE